MCSHTFSVTVNTRTVKMRVPNVQFPNICRDKRGRRELEATSIAQAVLPASTDYLTPYDTPPAPPASKTRREQTLLHHICCDKR